MNNYEITYHLSNGLSISEIVEADTQEQAFEKIRKDEVITIADETSETRVLCRFKVEDVVLTTVQIN
ncbi:MAG: hypothetical protein ACI4XL_04125 [Bacillus sp. (in: firmicutes)]